METGAYPIVTLGFCGEFYDLTDSHAGWNVWSLGYHGDDGWTFDGCGRVKHGIGRKFGPVNTVGREIDYRRKE